MASSIAAITTGSGRLVPRWAFPPEMAAQIQAFKDKYPKETL